MPITSTDIQNLIQAQMGMFGSTAAYTSQLSQQYGTSQGPPLTPTGGGSVIDPRSPAAAITGAQFGMRATQAAVGGAQFGMTGIGLAGMFSKNPMLSAFDPFSASLSAMRMGWGSGMAGGGVGTGAARALGAGGAVFGGYMAAGSAANWAANQVLEGAQNHMNRITMLSLYGGRSNLPMMGGLSAGGRGVMSNMMSGLSGPGGFSSSGVTDMVQHGLQSGMLRGATNVGQLSGQVRQLAQTARQVINALGMATQDGVAALQQVQQFQGMGFYGMKTAGNAISTMAGVSRSFGVSGQSLMGGMGQGAGMARQAGMHGATGAALSLQMSQRIGMGNINGSFGTDRLREMAGGAPLDQAIPMVGNQMVGAALGVGRSPLGGRVLAAMIDPDTGQIDPGRAQGFAAHAYSDRQIRRMARQNMSKRGVRHAMAARRGSLMQDLMGQIGPEGMLQGYAGATMNRSSMDGDPNDIMSGLIQKYSGLGEQQAQMIQQMAASPGMDSMIQKHLQREIQAQKQNLQMQKRYSVQGLMDQLAEKYVEPIRGPLRALGRRMVGAGEQAFRGAVDWMLGGERGTGMTQVPGLASPATRFLAENNIAAGPGGSMGGGPQGIGGPAGLAMDAFGLSDSWNPRVTGGIGAGVAAGYGMSALGKGVLPGSLPALGRGFMGRSAAFAGRGALGLGMMAAKPLAIGLGLAHGASTLLPEAMYASGSLMDTRGGVGGAGGRFLVEAAQADPSMRGKVGYSPLGNRSTPGALPINYDVPSIGDRLNPGAGADIWQVDAGYLKELGPRLDRALSAPRTALHDAGVQEDELDLMQRHYRAMRNTVLNQGLGKSDPAALMGGVQYLASQSPEFRSAFKRAGGDTVAALTIMKAMDPDDPRVRRMAASAADLSTGPGGGMPDYEGRMNRGAASMNQKFKLWATESGESEEAQGGLGSDSRGLFDSLATHPAMQAAQARFLEIQDKEVRGVAVGADVKEKARIALRALGNDTDLSPTMRRFVEANIVQPGMRMLEPGETSLVPGGSRSDVDNQVATMFFGARDSSGKYTPIRDNFVGGLPLRIGEIWHGESKRQNYEDLQGETETSFTDLYLDGQRLGGPTGLVPTMLDEGEDYWRSVRDGSPQSVRDKEYKEFGTSQRDFIKAALGESDREYAHDVIGAVRGKDPQLAAGADVAMRARNAMGKRGGIRGLKRVLHGVIRGMSGEDRAIYGKHLRGLKNKGDLDEHILGVQELLAKAGVSIADFDEADLRSAVEGGSDAINELGEELGAAHARGGGGSDLAKGFSGGGGRGRGGPGADMKALTDFTTQMKTLAGRFEKIAGSF